MTTKPTFKQEFSIEGGDFINGGDASCHIANILKDVGIDPDIILRITVAAYEAEMNAVIYAHSGTLYFTVEENKILLNVHDKGPGIENIQQAMKPGFSTASDKVREMGFGAGMGLPNIKKNSDSFTITSEPGVGTKLEICVNL
ncbi:MAG: anti-sigma regulatory factor [bacterium]|nr:anti-sigma regulatory factor [bacterium]